MDDIVRTDEMMDNRKIGILAAGAVLGALVGLSGAYLMLRNADENGEQISMNGGDIVRMGVLIFGLLRSVSNLGTKER